MLTSENKSQKEKANCAPLIYQSFCYNASIVIIWNSTKNLYKPDPG
jgi:hypothetical protein